MLPKHIKIRNIGPFLSEDIDFTKLDRLFLISGDTGSGKTFIFDCITYALYGKISGIRGELNTEVIASKYRQQEQDVFVDFIFGVGSTDYRIVRYLEKYSKPKTQTILLEKIEKGKEPVVIADKTGDANKKIIEILKYSIDDFSQIVLLPQGQFEKFIDSTSTEKAEILKKIFNVQKFTAITERIKSETRDRKKEIEILDKQFNGISEGEALTNLKKSKGEAESESARLKSFQEKGSWDLQQLTEKLTILENRKKDALKREETLRIQNEELAQKEEINAMEEKVALGKKALEAGEAYRNKENALELLEKRKSEHETAAEEMEKASEKKKEADSKSHLIPELDEQIKNLSGEIKDARGKAEKSLEYEKLIRQQKTLYEEKELSDEKISKTMERLLDNQKCIPTGSSFAQEESRLLKEKSLLTDKKQEEETALSDAKKRDNLITSREQYNKAILQMEGKLDSLEKQIDEKKMLREENAKRQELQGLMEKACEIASSLKENMPCPVCGSTDHPHPAVCTDSINYTQIIKTLEKEILELGNERDSLISELSKYKGNLDSYLENLETIKEARSVSEIEEKLSFIYGEIKKNDDLYKSLTEAKALNGQIEKELEKFKDALSDTQRKIALVEGSLETYKKELGEKPEASDKLSALAEKLESTLKTAENKKTDITTLITSAETEFAAASEKLKGQKTNLDEARKTSEKATALFEEKLKQQGIENEKTFLKMELDPVIMKDYQEKIQTHKDNLLACKTTLEGISETATSESLEKEIFETAEKRNELAKKLKALSSEQDKINLTLGNLNSKIKQLEDIEKKLGKLRDEYTLYEYLNSKFCYGNTLESWALASYYSTIVKFASQRLHDFSNGRYTLQQNTDNSYGRANSDNSLDLWVTDAHNGEKRQIKTLSGGERFQASLSLALAITDSVPYNLDSIFIDEGFGTLDAETRRKVMPILNNLKENKTVGIISHVEAFQEEIKSQIRLSKTESGSHVSII